MVEFVNSGMTFASFQSTGNTHCCNEAWNIKDKDGEVSFNRCAGIPSGPQALCTPKVLSSSSTPSVSTRIGLIAGFDCSCIMGRASSVTGVNTEVK